MKLLSRFIWLIVGISALVFSGITLVQIKATNEFELIKNSIKEEYDVQVDKMTSPDKYGAGIASYMADICDDASTSFFLSRPEPDEYFVEYNLHPEILEYNTVDAVWFFKPDGSLYYFKSNSNIKADQIPVAVNDIVTFFESEKLISFYAFTDNNAILFNAAKITESNLGHTGYVAMASILDNRWITKYESNINNSAINIVEASVTLPEIENNIIRITRDLKNYKNETVAILNVELHLPFLSLWHSTNSNDKWVMSISMIVIVLFLITFLIIWVISPLKRISSSLKNSTSEAIIPLVSGKTEMNEVARMIADYHKKTEDLEASESVKRHIFEQAQVGIIIAEAESGLINTTNPYACELMNAPEDAILGNVTVNFLAPIEDNMVNTESFESTLFDSKGNKIPIIRTSTKMMMDGRQVIMNTFVDLSEIKTLQNKLEDEKKKLSLAVQNSGLVFCEYDIQSDELSINSEWAFIANGESKNKGENIIQNIYDSDRKTIVDKIKLIQNSVKDAMVAEFRVNHPERGIIWLNVSILVSKRDENHKPKQLIGLLEDITERISVQQELIKAKEKAEESDRMKSSYLGNMSHKIRTPLNTIVGFANLLTEDEIEADERNNYINIIRNDTEQVLHLIDDMINIAKIDANQLDINKKTCHVNKIINSLTNYYKANSKTDKIKLNVKTMLDDGKDILQSDADKLYQVMSNLLNNAFKFTESGTIELGYFINPVDHKLILYVKDSGIGISNENKDKIFNRFFQVNPLSEGTGLGLSISQSIIKLLEGKLYFDSKLNEGSTFFIELPFKEI